MKKAELIELLENASASESKEAASEATEPEANTESEAKPSASQPAFLVVGVFDSNSRPTDYKSVALPAEL